MIRMVRLRNPQDLAAGLFLILIAVLAYVFAQDLPMGRAVRMGPGYMPVLLSYLLGGIGIAVAARGVTVAGPKLESWAWRPLLALTGSILVFAALLERAGLIITIVATVLAAGLAQPGGRVLSAVLLGVGLAAMSVALFVYLLGLPIPIKPGVFG